MLPLVFAGLLALGASLLITPLVVRLALRLGIVARPDSRKVHRNPVPTAGGLGLFVAFWVAVIGTAPSLREWTGFLLGSSLLVIVGLWDDRWGLRPWQKFMGQLVAAFILVAFGTRIDFVTNPLGGMIYVGWWGVPLTVLWVVALTNSLNFIDGLDGLAAGIAAIACIPLLVMAHQRDATGVVLLTACLLGASLGFLPFNFNPARVFMGDTGAMFLGFMLAAIAVEGALKGATAIALSIPLLTLGLPVFDTTCAVIRRGRHGRPIYQADAGHVHHRLLQLGLSHRQAVLVLYGVSGLLAAGALILLRVPASAATAGLILAGGLLALWARRLRIFDDQPAIPEGIEG